MPGKTLSLLGYPKHLVVWTIGDQPTIESYELSEVLGYVQAGSLRKQILSDWNEFMEEGEDFILTHDSVELREYEAYCKTVNLGPVKPVKPIRGYLFITGAGVGKVLTRTTKPVPDRLFNLLHNELEGLDPEPSPAVPAIVKQEETPAEPLTVPEVPTAVEPPVLSLEERRFHYEVLQTLFIQLQEDPGPVLREVAIMAAETALGKPLPELRLGFGFQALGEAISQSTWTSSQNQDRSVFTQHGWYSLTAIGDKAGGYSAVNAGKAANLVAARDHLTPTQIRTTKLPFNVLVTGRDTNNRERQMVRFNRMFSNRVILELRSNPAFTPLPVSRELASFSTPNTRSVNLSAPLNLEDDDDGLDSDHIETIIQTLQNEQH